MKNHTDIFAAYIGLDWADRKHDICLKPYDSDTFEFDIIEHSAEAIEAWALGLQKRFKNRPIAICLELKAGPIVYALLKYSFITLFPVSPKALAKYRETFTQSGAKDDPTDAFLQLDFLLKHGDVLKQLKPDSIDTRILQRLIEDRRSLVGDKVSLTNRITAALKSYYPQALQWFDDIDTMVFCEFIFKFPNLKKAKRAQKETIKKFFISHNCVRSNVINKRIKSINNAKPLTEDDGVIIPHEQLTQALCEQLKVVLKVIIEYDQKIEQRFKHHNDYKIFNSFPGAGAVFAPRLLAAMGSDRNRFDSAQEVQRFTGVAPVMERSGKKQWVHWRYSCPKFIRQTFVEWSRISLRYSYWAKEFYDKKRAQGKSHQATLRALAFKWIRIIYKCWKTNTTYDESAYLFALKGRLSEVK